MRYSPLVSRLPCSEWRTRERIRGQRRRRHLLLLLHQSLRVYLRKRSGKENLPFPSPITDSYLVPRYCALFSRELSRRATSIHPPAPRSLSLTLSLSAPVLHVMLPDLQAPARLALIHRRQCRGTGACCCCHCSAAAAAGVVLTSHCPLVRSAASERGFDVKKAHAADSLAVCCVSRHGTQRISPSL